MEVTLNKLGRGEGLLYPWPLSSLSLPPSIENHFRAVASTRNIPVKIDPCYISLGLLTIPKTRLDLVAIPIVGEERIYTEIIFHY